MLDKPKRPYRLGLDLGSNSLGWFVVYLEKCGNRFEPVDLGPGGVRIFPDGRDPQSKASNAVDRRMARGMRKRRDRFLQRQRLLLKALVKHGLMPPDARERKTLERLDPYRLRRDALATQLPAYYVGRALFHLNQRRGFLSNRKTERKADFEKGAIKQAEDNLKAGMDAGDTPTMGAFFAQKHLPVALVERQDIVRAELQRLGKDHLTGNARKKAWAKARKRLFGDVVLGRADAPSGVRARAEIKGAKASYEFYPTRELVRTEFNAIWTSQARHHAMMTDDALAHIAHVIFYQRPLKDGIVGKCTLSPAQGSIADDPDGYRTPWSHPLAQRYRIYSEARNLEVREGNKSARRLTKDESDAVAKALLGQKEVTFDKIRTLLKLPSDARFNLESDKRDRLKGDAVAERLSNAKCFAKAWRGLPPERQADIVDRLQETEDDDEIIGWLIAECKLNEAQARQVANTNLPDGHCRLGLRALRKIMPIMEGEFSDDGISGIRMYDAARRADPDYDPAQAPDGVLSQTGYLPYYGEWLRDDVVGTADPDDPIEKRFGRFPNPTVHIGLGQLRRIVNELIRNLRAPPDEISIEFTRGLRLSEDQKAEKQRSQARNQRDNEKRKAKILEVMGEHYDPTPRDLLKMRLWEELGNGDSADRKCPYSGDSIGIRRLLTGDVEVDHILPFAMTLDDSAANKTICTRAANQYKKKKTPFEAFGESRDGYDWEAICARAPKAKQWRFDKDAREKFEEKGGFLGRQLNETGWLARLAKKYLAAVTDPNQIWVVPGRLTSMIRGKWGLNSLLPDHNYSAVKERNADFAAATGDLEFSGVKNRADHRHHAIDGLVAALTDRSLLWKMAKANEEQRHKIEIPTPWDKDRFRDKLENTLKTMVVSHKPDHGPQGQLHEDTAYGFVADPEKEDGKYFVRRKTIESLSTKDVANIRDEHLRDLVQKHVIAEKSKGIDLKTALLSFKDTIDPHIRLGLRRIRVLVPEDPAFTVGIADRSSGRAYKAYAAGKNLYVDIVDIDGRWTGRAVTRFRANQPHGESGYLEGVPVMRLYKGDLIAVDHKGTRTVMVVRQLRQSICLLAAHNETGNLQARHENELDPFRWAMPSTAR